MPSPVGHALAAVAIGWALAPPSPGRRGLIASAAVLAAMGVAPDLDLLIGRHSRETHSLGAAAIAGGLAASWRWPLAAARWRIGLVVFLAWFSHPLLDALGNDTSPPLGVMAWWPFSSEHVQTAWSVFAPISRRWGGTAIAWNLLAIVREAAILGPAFTLVWWWRVRRPQSGAAK